MKKVSKSLLTAFLVFLLSIGNVTFNPNAVFASDENVVTPTEEPITEEAPQDNEPTEETPIEEEDNNETDPVDKEEDTEDPIIEAEDEKDEETPVLDNEGENNNIDDEIANVDINTDDDFVVPPLNYIPTDIDPELLKHKESQGLYPLLKESSLPTKYSLEGNAMTSVKDQAPYGTCWAFAAIASAESTYKKKTGEDIDLSELHLAWFTDNSYMKEDDLKLITNDGGEWMIDFEGELTDYDAPLDDGGNELYAFASLSNGIGFVKEETLEYPHKKQYMRRSKGTEEWEVIEESEVGLDRENYEYAYSWLSTFTSMPETSCYQAEYRLASTDMIAYEKGSEVTLDGIKELKMLIKNTGAVASSFCYESAYYNSDKYSYYKSSGDANHAITIVGWDDNYSKDNFVNTPPGNGAWRVKNSWGDSWGQKGYFWISYYDASLEGKAYCYSIEEVTEGTNDYNIYQYDGGNYKFEEFSDPNEVKLANIFTAQDTSTIAEIGLTTIAADMNYTVEVYSGVTNNNPESGEQVYKQTGKIANAGYHTVKFDNPEDNYDKNFVISKDTDFSIVITYEAINDDTNYSLSCNYSYGEEVYFHEDVTNDEGYIYENDNWQKLTDYAIPVKAHLKTVNPSYTVYYYGQNIDNNDYDVLLDTKIYTANAVDAWVTATPIDIAGFTYNDSVSESENTKEGTAVDGGTLELTLYYDRNSYNLTVAKETGIDTFTGGGTYKYEKEITVDTDFKAELKVGYKDLEYAYNPEVTVDENNKFKMPASNLTVTASATPITYYVKFNSVKPEGATGDILGTMSNQEFKYDTEQSLTKDAYELTGYTFAGWSTSETGDVTYSDEKKVLNLSSTDNDTVNLYTKWTANTYKVVFNANNGTGTMSNQNFTYDVSQNLLENKFSRVGYTFAGWNTSADGSGTSYDDKASAKNLATSGTTTLYAKWTANTYKVHFDANEPETTSGVAIGTMTDQDFTYDTEQSLTKNSYELAGYTFIGWATSETGDVKYIDEKAVTNLTATVNGTVNLYAKWTANTYKVHFDSNKPADVEGNITGTMNDQDFTYDVEQILTQNAFELTDYAFVGWNTKADGSGTTYSNKASAKNLATSGTTTLYAKWEGLKVKLISSAEGATSFDKGDTLYLNGQQITVPDSGEIAIKDNQNLIVTYETYNSSATDNHLKYPVSMNVYLLEDVNNDGHKEAVHYDNYDDILTYEGTSIRVTGDKGIRIKTSIPTAKKNSLINSGIDNYKVMEYGTIICWADDLNKDTKEEPSLYYDSTLAKNNYQPTKGAKGRAYSREANINTYISEKNGTTIYTNVLIDSNNTWNETKCKKDFAMRSYMIIRPKTAKDASDDVIIYGGTLYRSISYAAYQSRHDFNTGTDAYNYVWNLMSKDEYPTHKITYKDEGDVAFSGKHASKYPYYPDQYIEGDITLLDTPTKSGYTFEGWYTTSDCSGTAITQIDATATATYTDQTLYAKWSKQS